jgi:hypothetical protein
MFAMTIRRTGWMLALAWLASVAQGSEALHVTAAHGDALEIRLKQHIEDDVTRHHLGQWLFTKKVVIDKNVWPPHSHPVLTLGVSYAFLTDEVYRVSNLLHEEFHWDMQMNGRLSPEEVTAALKGSFPGLDPAPPQGSGSEVSTYSHVLVCYLEYRALAGLFGEEAALKSIRARRYYTDVYAIIVDSKNRPAIEAVLQRDGIPIPTRTPTH